MDILNNLSTCRQYNKNLKINDSEILEIIKEAKQSPSWQNGQAYHIVVLDGKVKTKVANLFSGQNQHIEDCSHFMLFFADLSKFETLFKIHNKKMADFDIFELLIATTDAAIAAQTASIAAQSRGIETCYIGMIRMFEKELKEILNVPKYSYCVFGLTLGYPNKEYKKIRKPRLKNEINVSFNNYESNLTKENIEEYDKEIKNLNEPREKYLWSEKFLHSYSNEKAENLKNFLIEQKLLKK